VFEGTGVNVESNYKTNAISITMKQMKVKTNRAQLAKNVTNTEKRRRAEEKLDDDVNSVDTLVEHLLNCGTDLTLLTLKGHLVIESSLNTILARLLRIPSLPMYPAIGALEFCQKLKLVEEFVIHNFESGPNSDIFNAIWKLNKLRNQLGHTLRKPDEFQGLLRPLLDSFSAAVGEKPFHGTDMSVPLRCCLNRLWKFLYQVRDYCFEMEMERLSQR
jgi:hypothetical protein